MATSKVSLQDQKEIEKYIKRLIFKFIQTVLQSRLSTKAQSPSRLFATRTDWFNLSIPDLPEVTAKTKNAFGRHPVDLTRPICIEISLKTAEEETMLLEYWWLQNTTKQTDLGQKELSFKMPSIIYNLIGKLLRSLLMVTRATPAYQLSRNQSRSSYHILHRIQFAEPEIYPEDDFKKQLVGTFPSSLGVITLNVAYKTKLLICPRKATDLTSDIKDDYFNVEVTSVGLINPDNTSHPYSDKHDGFQTINSNQRDSLKPKRAAFGPQLPQPVEVSAETNEAVPFSMLLQLASASPIASHRKRHESEDDSRTATKHTDEGIEIVVGQSMQQSGDSISNQSTSSCSSLAKDCAIKDDFVMVELRAPFARQEEELGRFYRECQMAPSLSMFEEPADFHETLNSITDQLAQFEASAMDFNEFVNSLQVIDT